MRVLITGITGMVGSHLADYLLKEDPEIEIHGLVRWRSSLKNIASILPQVTLHHGDLTDLVSMTKVIEDSKPHWIFHLAAQSYVQTSYTAPVDTMTTNVIGTINLLEAVRSCKLDPLIHVCSSSEVYGQVFEHELPITEDNPFRPASPYAVSKVGQDMVAAQYCSSYGMKILRTRMFTHTGPRRASVFAEASFARQIALIETGKLKGPIKVGNLDSIRTFADVRDAVRAYYMMMRSCPPGEVYNIGGDNTMTVGEMLEIMVTFSSRLHQHPLVDPSLLRPSDVTRQIPDSSKFRNDTGWKPEIPLPQTLKDLLDYYRQEISND